MRNLLVIPITLALTALAAWYGAGALHIGLHGRDVATAAILCGVSAELGLLPAALKRRAGVLALFQASLVGTVLHLIVTLLVGAVICLGHLVVDNRLFLYVLIVFYWISLLAMVTQLARFLREASAAPADGTAAAAQPPKVS